MGDPADRQTWEDELAAAILAAFGSIHRINDASFDELKTGVSDALETYLSQTAAGSATLYLQDMHDLDILDITKAADQAKAWAAGFAPAAADELVGRWRAALEQDKAENISIALLLSGFFTSAKARDVAVTETTRAISFGEHVGQAFAETKGSDLLVPYWIISAGACFICKPYRSTPPSVWRKKFPFGPPAHPNCRCYLDWRKS